MLGFFPFALSFCMLESIFNSAITASDTGSPAFGVPSGSPSCSSSDSPKASKALVFAFGAKLRRAFLGRPLDCEIAHPSHNHCRIEAWSYRGQRRAKGTHRRCGPEEAYKKPSFEEPNGDHLHSGSVPYHSRSRKSADIPEDSPERPEKGNGRSGAIPSEPVWLAIQPASGPRTASSSQSHSNLGLRRQASKHRLLSIRSPATVLARLSQGCAHEWFPGSPPLEVCMGACFAAISAVTT